jgi:hypothetical protein
MRHGKLDTVLANQPLTRGLLLQSPHGVEKKHVITVRLMASAMAFSTYILTLSSSFS